jgi:hypothetical protein
MAVIQSNVRLSLSKPYRRMNRLQYVYISTTLRQAQCDIAQYEILRYNRLNLTLK